MPRASKDKDKGYLTYKQQLFVDYYAGNATEAAIQAGYSKKSAGLIGAENLKKPAIAAAIDAKLQEARSKAISSRADRQAFWTAVMKSRTEDTKNRLRASELLGKSEGDFIERVKQEGPTQIIVKTSMPGPKPLPPEFDSDPDDD